MNKFVVFTVPRSGSTLLIKTLDAHAEIFCAGEVFYFSGKTYHTECQYRFWRLPFLNNKFNYLLNYPKILLTLTNFLHQFYASEDGTLKAKGFKLMYYQTLYTPGVLNYLKKNDVKVILLQRENLLRNALSDLRARATGVYHNEGNNGIEQLPKLKVNIPGLKNKIEQIAKTQDVMEKLTEGMDTLNISYEELNENWSEAIKKVLNFLNVTGIALPASVKKLNPEELEDMIENYEEVKNWLGQNKYEQYLQYQS